MAFSIGRHRHTGRNSPPPDKRFGCPPHVLPLEMRVANLINADRESHGLRRLAYDWQLAAVARAHSGEMAALGYFAHESPTAGRREPWDRYVLGFGRQPRYVAENVFRSFSSHQRPLAVELANDAHEGLMNSPGHRANILSCEPTQMGIGVFANANGDIWVTELFSRS